MNASNKGLNAGISARNAVSAVTSTVVDKSSVAGKAVASNGKTAYQYVTGFLTGFIKGEPPVKTRKPRTVKAKPVTPKAKAPKAKSAKKATA
jgi:hypothetical protein